MTTTVLVVEDESAILELISINLEFDGYRVWHACDARQALALIRDELPDVILLDWMLPDIPGVTLARQLRGEARTHDIPLIMLTAKTDERDKIEGLEAGADDYVTKPFSPKELRARIKALLRRRAPQLTDDTVHAGALRLDPATRRASVGDQPLTLGPTEFRLLHFFMTHAGRVFSRAQLLDQVWGDHVFVEERTVDVHIRRLRRALEPTGREDTVETVRGAGYRFSLPTVPRRPP
ncbi:MAG: phosphate regulon transcriptional regulatory protein PhoB [Candidimonas sp.]|nr:MAG: phosphate regulon transcriptional regulatory protein PhoB [Candidimonas sp.]